MWWVSGLIVIIMGSGGAAFKLSCIVNYLDDVNQQGVEIYMGEGGERVNIFKYLVNSNDVPWTIVDKFFEYTGLNLGFPGNYLILSSDADSPDEIVHSAINHLSSENMWDPSARMIVVVSPLKTSDMHSIASTLISRLWENMVYDTVIAFVSGDEVLELISASPFDDGNECGLKVKKHRVLKCGDYKSSGLIWHHPEVYPNCTFRVSRRQSPPFSFNLTQTHFVKAETGEWQGVDIQFVKLLRARKKLFVEWSERMSPESGAPEEEVHQYYGNFNRYGIDLAVGGNAISSKYMGKVAYLRTHNQQHLLYIVADPDYMRGWPILHSMFSTNTWIVLGFAIFLAGIVYGMITEGRIDITSTRFLTVFAILVTQTILQPKRWPPRLMLTALLLPLYHISSLHITNLQSFMVHTPLNKGITSKEDLRAANVAVYISDANRFFILEKTNCHHYVTSKVELNTLLLQLNNYRNFSILTRSLEANFFINTNQLRVHPLNEGATVLSITMAMGKGNVYFDAVDNLVQQCLQVGIFAKWMQDLTLLKRHKTVSVVTITNDTTGPERPALDLIDLEYSFRLLFAGYIVATTAFICEHLLHRWEMRIRRQKHDMMVRQKRLERKFKH